MIVLASGSAARARMLQEAGIGFTVEVAAVDERAVKDSLAAETRNPARVAEVLAELKAVRVSSRHPGALVIGADQMLDCDGAWFDKPVDRQAARVQLLALRHKTHRLTSAVVAVRDGHRVWYHTDEAVLTMRNFSESFLDLYLEEVGEAAVEEEIADVVAVIIAVVDAGEVEAEETRLQPILGFLKGNYMTDFAISIHF